MNISGMFAGRYGMAELPMLLRRFASWWLREFLNLLPEAILARLTGRGRVLIVVAADQEGALLELVDGTGHRLASARAAASPAEEIDRLLRSLGIDKADADLAVRLPASELFCRHLVLPRQAAQAIDSIVAQDLANNTPFKAADIHSDYTALEGKDGSRITILQWIVRRDDVDQALSALGLEREDLAFVISDSHASGQPAPSISLRPRLKDRPSWPHRLELVLSGSALVLALAAGGLRYWDQQSAMERIAAEIEVTGRKAQEVRALVNQLQAKQNALLRLRLQRSEAPGLIDLWEETTRVLPLNSWLTEFRLSETAGKREQLVSLSGFSSAAPALVGILDGSPLFFDVGLTSPIALDGTEGRDRFALQGKVRLPPTLKQDALKQDALKQDALKDARR